MDKQQFTTDDGRRAERHITTDSDGNETEEIFAEEKRPLKLEKRVLREFRQRLAKETHETIRDGEAVHVEILAGSPDVPLRVVDRIGTVNHAKIVDGDYVRKDELGKIVADAVVTGVTALLDQPFQNLQPKVSARKFVADVEADKSKTEPDKWFVVLCACVCVILLGVAAYALFVF